MLLDGNNKKNKRRIIMNTYENSRKTLNKIRQEFGCKGDVIFRTAIQYVVEYGQNTFSDNGWVENQLTLIDVKHDKAEAEGKMLWIGREFERAFIECAVEIAKVNTYDLLIYIQKEVFWSEEGGLDYARAMELLHNCINWFVDYDCCETAVMRERLEDLEFTEDELYTLGLDWLFDTVEEDE
jgi:hypothetical protein